MVFLYIICREQRLLGSVVRIETLDGLEDETVNNLLVIVPIERDILQYRSEAIVVDHKFLIELTYQFPVVLIVTMTAVSIVTEDLIFGPLRIETLHETFFVGPSELLFLLPFHQGGVFRELLQKTVFCNEHIGLCRTQSGTCTHIHLVPCQTLYLDKKGKKCVIEVVRFVKAVVKFRQGHLCSLALIVIVGIDKLHYFETD